MFQNKYFSLNIPDTSLFTEVTNQEVKIKYNSLRNINIKNYINIDGVITVRVELFLT